MAGSVLRMTYDRDADAAFVCLQPSAVVQPSVVTTMTVNDSINLDFDDRGRLVGVEVLGSALLHSDLLAEIADAP